MSWYYPNFGLHGLQQPTSFGNIKKGFSKPVISVATQTIVTSAILKQHCRIDSDITDDDGTLNLYLKAAEQKVEGDAEVALRLQVREMWLERLPSFNAKGIVLVRLESPPLTAVNSVKYYDTNDVQQTFSPSLYSVLLDGNPPLVYIKQTDVPFYSLFKEDVWRFNYTCGVAGVDKANATGGDVGAKSGDSTLPENAQLAMAQLVAYWFRNKEAFSERAAPQHGPYSGLIDSIRWRGYP